MVTSVIEKLELELEFFRKHLGIKINLESIKDKPMMFIQRLVGMLGFKFPKLARKGSRKDRKSIFGKAAHDFVRDKDGHLKLDGNNQAIPIFDNRNEVFTAWLLKDAEKLEKYKHDKEHELEYKQELENYYKAKDIELTNQPVEPLVEVNQPSQPQPIQETIQKLTKADVTIRHIHCLDAILHNKNFKAIEGTEEATQQLLSNLTNKADWREYILSVFDVVKYPFLARFETV
jgi:hypothetical protein